MMNSTILLPDVPETVIANHLIKNNYCKLFVSNDHIIVQSDFGPEELIGFGSDANEIFQLLKQIKGWRCIVLDTNVATKLGDLLLSNTKINVRYLTDVYHTNNQKIITNKNYEGASLLKAENTEEIQIITKEFEINGFKTINELLVNGFLVFSKIEDQIVSITYTSALSQKYADIGTFTKEAFRGQGFSTANATLVVNKVLEIGKIPIWSCGDTNSGSLKVAQKLGFKEVSRRKYVIGSPLLD